jgi:hypothetical protein
VENLVTVFIGVWQFLPASGSCAKWAFQRIRPSFRAEELQKNPKIWQLQQYDYKRFFGVFWHLSISA